MTNDAPDAVFRFESPELTVEFEGPEEWVSAQIEHFADRMRQAMESAVRATARPTDVPGAALASPAAVPVKDVPARPEAPSPANASPPELENFYASARSREGRGALQEQILIFAYYLQTYGGRDDVSIREIADCFERVNATPPRNLANTLGIMKRSQGFFAAGSGRGRYRLTDAGLAYVRRLVGAH